MFHEEMHYLPEELHEFSDLYRQKIKEYLWVWTLRMWDNGRRNIKLGQVEFIDMGSLSQDCACSATQKVRKGFLTISSFGWLKHEPKNGPQ